MFQINKYIQKLMELVNVSYLVKLTLSFHQNKNRDSVDEFDMTKENNHNKQ